MTLLQQVDVPIAIESDSTLSRPTPVTRMPGARLAATAGIAGWVEELVGIVRDARRRDGARRQPIVRRPNVMT